MSRGELSNLKALIGAADAGGYTLPAELVAAFEVYRETLALETTPPERLDVQTAGARVVQTIKAGKQPDLTELGRAVNQATTDGAAHDKAKAILDQAQEQAGNTATLLGADLVERVIVESLRPALVLVHEQARAAADAMDGYTLDPASLLEAPAEVRTAYLALAPLVTQRSAIYQARRLINFIGHREPQHDIGHLFGLFRHPMTFHPEWKAPARIPPLPVPDDPTAALLFMVSDAAEAAQPWLPTIAEQDAAWWAEFGEMQQARSNASHFARGLTG